MDHVRGDDAVGAVRPGRDLPRAHVRVDPGAGGVRRRQALGEHRADHAREHVAGAGGGERGRAAARDRDAAAGRDDQRVVALEHDERARRGGGLAGRARAGGRATSVELTPSSRPSSPACGVSTVVQRRCGRSSGKHALERVEAVGVDHERHVDALEHLQRERRARRRTSRAPARARPRRRGRSPSARARPPRGDSAPPVSGRPTIIASSSLTVNESSRLAGAPTVT